VVAIEKNALLAALAPLVAAGTYRLTWVLSVDAAP
jgi:hypothetical protein